MGSDLSADRRAFLKTAVIGGLLARIPTPAQAKKTSRKTCLAFESSDAKLSVGFEWAKLQALAYVNEGDPVGPWIEASLPQREGFCIRDVSHQRSGAHFLGLAEFNRNMLLMFAESISESRDWCCYWEIHKSSKPMAVDYQDDQHFWYCLPANFDMLDACWRQYAWTRNREYLTHPAFLNFYERTVHDYVARWDKDHDGIPESYGEYGTRGLGSYDENRGLHVRQGADLLLKQHAGLLAYARIQDLRGNAEAAGALRERARKLHQTYDAVWWDADRQRHFPAMLQDQTMCRDCRIGLAQFPMEGAVPSPAEWDATLPAAGDEVEVLSYYAEGYFRYGRNQRGYDMLLRLTDPGLRRREYPEVSYSVIGAIGTGLMGVQPQLTASGVHSDTLDGMVRTLPGLPESVSWCVLSGIPVGDNMISVRHDGNHKTTFTNQSGPSLVWKACLSGNSDALLIDGKLSTRMAEKEMLPDGALASYVIVRVETGKTVSLERKMPVA